LDGCYRGYPGLNGLADQIIYQPFGGYFTNVFVIDTEAATA
jgi:hypothetical protein